MRDVPLLTKNLSNDLMLKRALEEIGYTDGRPLFRARHPTFNTATSHNVPGALGSVCAEDHKNSGVKHHQMRKPSLQGIVCGSMLVQHDSNLLLTP